MKKLVGCIQGRLRDGTAVAIKVLSTESKQGIREFLTEITVVSDISHENLVKLHGCCVEGTHRILLYSYLENNSLSQTLLNPRGYSRSKQLVFNWETRRKICIGVARGLAYLHEELKPPIIHRDIKASNILLDNDLNPKISDFGLARLLSADKTHVSTDVAGTLGYLAPEYAMRGQVTKKADVYSFGVLLLEIVCGRHNDNPKLPAGHRFLLERVWVLHETGEIANIVDTELIGLPDFNVEEACSFLRVGLLCTQGTLNYRPSMSSIVKMLMGQRDVNMLKIDRPGLITDLFDIGKKTDSTTSKTRNTNSTTQIMSINSSESAPFIKISHP